MPTIESGRSNLPPLDIDKTSSDDLLINQDAIFPVSLLSVTQEDKMKTFVMMTKVAAHDADLVELASRLQNRERQGAAWIERVCKECPRVRFLAHYALLGPWDFMDIYEAPDEETAAIVSIITRAHGAHQVESWVAIPVKPNGGCAGDGFKKN